jgi:hypothetical protein
MNPRIRPDHPGVGNFTIAETEPPISAVSARKEIAL